jgi:hypothetical protein
MNEDEIYSGVADILTDKPYTLRIPIRWAPEPKPVKRSLLDRLLRRALPAEHPETIRTFEIFPCVVANMYRIAGRAVLLPKEILGSSELTESVLPLIPEHLPNMVYIIASAIQNNHLEPAPELLVFIERNFTQVQISNALYASIEGLGLQDFLNSIVLAKGSVSILKPKTSPVDGRE